MTDGTDGAGAATTAARVGDVMSAPIVSCQADVPLAEVAALMARHRIHAVVVVGDAGEDDARGWRVISEADLVRAVGFDQGEAGAGSIAATPVVTIGRRKPLQEAALRMSEHETTHLVVVENGHPVGIVSALDVAASLVAPAEPAPEPAEKAPEGALTGHPGDRLVISGHHLGEVERDAEILEARGPGGSAPFLVRWEDTGHVTLLYPGSDARVQHLDTT